MKQLGNRTIISKEVGQQEVHQYLSEDRGKDLDLLWPDEGHWGDIARLECLRLPLDNLWP